jgi:hypothetical protein
MITNIKHLSLVKHNLSKLKCIEHPIISLIVRLV